MEIQPANLESNGAPLLDILLNLLVFFIMACEDAAQEYIKINSPVVRNPVAVDRLAPQQVVVNILPDPEDPRGKAAKFFNIFTVNYDPYDYKQVRSVLKTAFERQLAAGRSPQVTLRAFDTCAYEFVYQALIEISMALQEAKVPPKDQILNVEIIKDL